MFNKKKNSAPKKMELETIIGENVRFEGTLSSTQAIRLDGFVKGDIDVSDMLIIGETGKVFGNIKAGGMMCAGKIQGDIDIKDTAEFISGGALIGNIVTQNLIMPENVYFKGSCTMKNTEISGEGFIEAPPAQDVVAPVENTVG